MRVVCSVSVYIYLHIMPWNKNELLLPVYIFNLSLRTSRMIGFSVCL
uniref:Uncharacterized protein n=1 Tax=Anguilla anguilla TaxID=7936 RepID=A0A0E9W7F6_ANGAN